MEKPAPGRKRSGHTGVPVDPEIRSRPADPLNFEFIGLSGSSQFLIAGGGIARVTVLMSPFSTVRHRSGLDLEPLATGKLCVFDFPCSKPIGYFLGGHPLGSSRSEFPRSPPLRPGAEDDSFQRLYLDICSLPVRMDSETSKLAMFPVTGS